jgi:hypothetical protein
MLANVLRALTSSEDWHRYLDFQSRFHNYSFGNVLLIAAQFQRATQVAGFNAWRRLNRHVSKGEKAIWILAPMVYRVESSADREGTDRVVPGFKFVPVFDISQTKGEEPPSVCRQLVGHDPANCFAGMVKLAGELGFSVSDHCFSQGTNSDCSHAERLIRIEARNSSAQRVKTPAHELAHAILHESY